ncbi:hypothetical protein WDW86_08775 [Bdellovibrionota bacterium FG-2]
MNKFIFPHGLSRWMFVLTILTLSCAEFMVSCSSKTTPPLPQESQQPGIAPTTIPTAEPPETPTETPTSPSPVPDAPGTAPSPSAQPAPLPSAIPSPSPIPTPTETVTWSIVSEKKDCPYPLCKGRGLFWIDSTGHYFQEREQESEDDFRFPDALRAQGRITPSERVELSAIADVVAEQNFSHWMSCSPMSPVPGMSSVTLQMWFTDWTLQTIYKVDVQNEEACHAGSLPKALALYRVLDTLVNKYYIIPSSYEPCRDKACGEQCKICSPDDPTCEETAVIKHCDAQKHCVPGVVSCPPAAISH